jgi:excisionase family DNA binding protein
MAAFRVQRSSRVSRPPWSEKNAVTDVFTTGQVAKICKVSPRTVNKWFDSGRLRGYRATGSQVRRVPRTNLIQFLQEHGMPLGELGADFAPVRRRARHHRRRARALARQRDYPQALKELDESLLQLSDERTLRTRAFIHYRLGDYDKALADLNAALHRPWHSRALHLRARIFYRRGAYDLALSDLNAVIRSNPKAEAAYRLRARVHRRMAGLDRQTAAQLAGRRAPGPQG